MKKTFLTFIMLVLFSVTSLFSQTTLQTVNFETTSGYTVSPAESNANNGTSPDYWIRTNGTSPTIYPTNGFTTSDGSYYFAGEDLDYAGAGDHTVTFDAVTVSGYSSLQVKLLVGGRSGTSGIEGEEFLKIQYNMDGGGWTTRAQFIGDGRTNYYEDANADGTIDGSSIDETLSDYTYTIPTTGSSLQIRVYILCGGSEELAFDNLRVLGTVAACTEPTIPTLSASPTSICSGNSSILSISGSLNDATAWHFYTGSCGGTSIGNTSSSTFSVSPTSTTTYFIRGEGGCVTPGSCATVTVNITPPDNASFSYSAAAYCVDASDPTPTITGLAGGTFSSTAGLSISASTGAIDVSTSTPGTYTVTYTTAGTCPNSSNTSITINALDNPSFSYSSAAYCVDASDPTPTITGLAGGTFSSNAGLSISASTGAIDVSTSTPGIYTVTYTTAGTCPNSSNTSITINALDNPSFNYSSASYCVSASDPTPTITGLAGGTFSSTAGLSLTSGSGTIDVSISTPGTYTVTYTTAGTCPNSSNTSITINAIDNPSFSYSSTTYCVDASDPTPTITGLAGGTFSSNAGLSISASTGAIDVSTSTPGTYTVTYTTAGTCPNSSNTSITINALDNPSFNYSSASYCVSASDPTPTITGLAGGTFSSTAGLSLTSGSGTIDVSISTPGTYTVTYTTAGTCPNSSNTSITINAIDNPSFSYSSAVYCVDASDPTPTITGLAGGTFSSTAGLSLNSGSGAIDVSISTPGTYTVTYTTAGTCPNSSNTSITINALDDPSFSYSSTAYCVDASDPTPTITGLAGGTFSSNAGLALTAGSGNIDVSISTPGTYTVTYTTAGTCPNSSNTSITINALDNPSFSYSSAAYCVDASDPTPTITGLAGGTFSSNAGLSISASTGAIDVSTSTPGIYTVTYTTAGTCPNSSNQIVTINPIYNLTETDAVCSGESYTFPDGTTQDNITAQVVYTSNLQTDGYLCDSIIVTTVNVNPVYNLTETDAVCSGENYTFPDGTTQDNITAQVVYTSNLQTDGYLCDSIIVTTVHVNPLYNLTETDAVCSGESYTFPDGTTQDNITAQVVYTSNLQTVGYLCDSIIVTTVNVNPVYNLTETDAVCSGGSYTFPDGITQDNITAQVVYTSNLQTDGYLCDSIIVTTVDVIVVDTLITKTERTLTATAIADAYQWLDCNNSYAIIPNEMSQSFTASINGSYAVEIIDNGCIDTSSCISIITVGLIENAFENNISIFPNPTNGIINIDLERESSEIKLKVIDITGKVIKEYIYIRTKKISINLEEIPSGLYLFEVSTKLRKNVFKVVKK